jgi:acetyltransferase
MPASDVRQFGDLTPLLAPRSIAVIGASDRAGNLGGTAVVFLRKFGFQGPVWPVNSAQAVVAELPCYARLEDLPAVPDLAILAVPAPAVLGVLKECVAAGVPSAIVWAGGFAEQGPAGRALQAELEAVCRASGILLCGPNCIGIINTSIGLTASFSSMLSDQQRLMQGSVSIVSQSGGISVMAHSRAQQMGLGFRVTISVGNEAAIGIPEFIRALAQDDGTKVIAVYTEGLSDPRAFIEALAEARRCGKPVVMLKGGSTEASSRAALAHTGRLAGFDRTYDAIFREFAVIRVYSTEEMLDVCLQLASLKNGQLPAGNRVLISSFGGGSGVMCTDQCGREGLQVNVFDDATIAHIKPLLTPLSSALNPIDLTPGMMTNAKHRADMPAALQALANAPGTDAWLFMAAGFAELAPELVKMFDEIRQRCDKPILLTWQSMPDGIAKALAERGIYTFSEHARAVRTLGHLVRHAENLRHHIQQVPIDATPFDWIQHVNVNAGAATVSENVVARILEAAALPVARGRIAVTPEDAARAAKEIGFPVAIKGISPAITHRAAVGLVALSLDSAEAVAKTCQAFQRRAEALGKTLEGTWVQHMFAGERELLVTAFRDQEFGVMVGCGMGGGMTEIIDDAVFTRAPIDAAGALDLVCQLRTLRRLPEVLTPFQRDMAAGFIARFSMLAASAPWKNFTLEVNPVKLSDNDLAAVDGLLLID